MWKGKDERMRWEESVEKSGWDKYQNPEDKVGTSGRIFMGTPLSLPNNTIRFCLCTFSPSLIECTFPLYCSAAPLGRQLFK